MSITATYARKDGGAVFPLLAAAGAASTAALLLMLYRENKRANKNAHKMISGRSSIRFDNARRRLLACGYNVAECELTEIHCNQQPGCEDLEWIENGFVQGFVTVDGRSARVMDYAPGQLLQPHKHDLDELFEIRGGSVEVSTWPEGKEGKKETKILKAGDLIEIPSGVPHSLCCDKDAGLQFHELVGEGTEVFAKRATTFLIKDGFERPKLAVALSS